MLPLITLEEHWLSPSVRAVTAKDHFTVFPEPMVKKLESLGSERIQDMDSGNVSLQVLSHVPMIAASAAYSKANDELYAATKKHPTRFAGFAALNMLEPEEAAKELERSVKELGFVGALIDNHTEGVFYDSPKYWPVFATAEKLGVPIYIHPSFASETMLQHYKGNYPDAVAEALSAYGIGWHFDTALHILRLFASGFFDAHPKIKIIVGHMGEMLPFQLDRICGMSQRIRKTDRDLRTVWNENIWVTTAGMFSLAPLACLLRTTTRDRVLYSVDYPFSPNEKGKTFFDEVKESGLLSEEELEMFAYKNAEKLLGVKAVTG